MARKLRLPAALTAGPFKLADAERHGIYRGRLRGLRWRRVGPGTYQSIDVEDNPETRLRAAALRMPSGSVFSGNVAAWLYGLSVAPPGPIEITVPPDCGAAARVGMTVRRCELTRAEVTSVRGFFVTSPARTVRDLCAGVSLSEAVVVVDMALHARLQHRRSHQ